MEKYYKPKPKPPYTEDQKERRKRLFFDKRVKQILICPDCSGPLTAAEARRNRGICDECANNT